MVFWIRTSNIVLFVLNGLIKGAIEKSSDQFLGLIVMSHWLGEVWIQIWDVLFVLPLSLFHLENHVCLSRGVQVSVAAWWVATRIRDGRTGRVLSGQAIERSGGVVCGLHLARENKKRMFVGWASKPRWTVCQWFSLKTTGTVCEWFGLKTTRMASPGLASKPVVRFSPVWP
jgi:hypothetical protein